MRERLSTWKAASAILAFCVAAIGAPAQTVTTQSSFNGTNGSAPLTSPVQGIDGNFYGSTYRGGADTTLCGGYGCGTVYRMTPAGALKTLYSFCSTTNCADGAGPWGLVQATDGNFYGTTVYGGANQSTDCPYGGCGTVFRITPAGKLTTLYSFCAQAKCADGVDPQARLVEGTDGQFYGTTAGPNGGTVFRITALGKLTELYTFCSQANCTDGSFPGDLVQAADGNFYGTTANGGDNYLCGSLYCEGTIFRITPAGLLTTLYPFESNGSLPNSPLVEDADGSFYGTTQTGGIVSATCYNTPPYGCGTVFHITAKGTLTSLYSFCAQTNCTDGYGPTAGLAQAGDGSLYGTTNGGGAGGNSDGTVFKVAPSVTLTTLYTFCAQGNCADGAGPAGALVEATNGKFYGTTAQGGIESKNCGNGSCGTVFTLDDGLGPFVSLLRNSGKVGQTAQILGQGFTGTTSVSFDGTPAVFTIKSDTFLTAAVPAGATTGFITVATPSGMLKSNKTFRVVPEILSFSPTSGPVGTSVVITGNSFTGASVLTFACKWKMSFTVDSDTQITAIIPAAGTSGTIAVRTPGARVESSTKFTVTP